MTVTAKSSRKVIVGAGWANPLTHDFLLENASYVHVYADDVELVGGVDYVVSNVLNPAGYVITIVVPGSWAPTNWVLDVVMPMTQEKDLTVGGTFGAKFEEGLDKLTRRMQYVYDLARRGLKTSPSTAVGDDNYDLPAPSADKLIGWNAAGDNLENKDPVTLDIALVDNDVTMAADSATRVPSQHVVKTFAAAKPTIVSSRTALRALDTALNTVASLTEAGREGTFVWRTGDFSALVTADTQEGIYIKADAIAATVGTWVRQNDGEWLTTWFGMSTAATGAANVTAFTAACNLAKGLLGAVHVPAGLSKYVMASLVTITMANNDKLHFTGDGYASSMLAWPGTNGIQIDMIAGPWWLMSAGAPGNAVTFDGIGFVTDGDGVANTAAGVALAVNGNNSAGRPSPAFIIQNCRFLSSIASSCWSRGMILTSVSSVVIDKCQWYGCSNQRDIGIFILLAATNTHDASPYHISNCEAYFFSAAIQAGAYIEGIHVSHCDLVSGTYGIVWDASSSGGESQLCAVGVHTNTTTRGIWTTNVQHSQISDCLCFITAASGTAIDIVDGSSLTIHGNVISCGSLAATSGIVFRASAFAAANYLLRASSVGNNVVENAAIGINLGVAVRNVRVGPNTFVNCTADMGDADLVNGLVSYGGTAITPYTNDNMALGSTTKAWADLFLASGGVVDFNNGSAKIIHQTAPGLLYQVNGTNAMFMSDTVFRPSANDGVALGAGAIAWADLFLATGGIINWGNGNVTLSHTTGVLTASGTLVATQFFVGANKVVGARDTGWTAMTGTGSKGALAAAAAGTASAAYVQAELQGALNRIAALEARLRSLDAALITHGLIGT